MAIATTIIDLSIQMAGQTAGGSQVITLGIVDSTIQNPGAANIFKQVVVSSATLNAAIASAWASAGASLT